MARCGASRLRDWAIVPRHSQALCPTFPMLPLSRGRQCFANAAQGRRHRNGTELASFPQVPGMVPGRITRIGLYERGPRPCLILAAFLAASATLSSRSSAFLSVCWKDCWEASASKHRHGPPLPAFASLMKGRTLNFTTPAFAKARAAYPMPNRLPAPARVSLAHSNAASLRSSRASLRWTCAQSSPKVGVFTFSQARGYGRGSATDGARSSRRRSMRKRTGRTSAAAEAGLHLILPLKRPQRIDPIHCGRAITHYQPQCDR